MKNATIEGYDPRPARAPGTNGARNRSVPEAEMRRRLEAVLDDLAAGKGIEHVVLGVESVHGTFSWAGTRGDANPGGPPMRPQTPYYIASIDKLFTAVVVMRLFERGLLDIDKGIGEYLDEELVDRLHVWQGRDLSRSITVRNLLSHTSGLANYLEDRPRGGKSLFETLATEGDKAWTVEEATRTVREKLKPHFPPQSTRPGRQRIRYSDTNFALLHAIIESVSGRRLHEAFEAELFEPLGLHDTWVAGWPRGDANDVAISTLWFQDAPLELPLAMRSLDGIYSNIPDQLRFLRALVGGEVFDDPKTFDLMLARFNRFGIPLDPVALRAPSWPIEYGLGIKRFRLPRLLAGSKPMPVLFGHSGSTGTWLFYSPDLDLSMAGAVDQATAGAVPYRLLPKLARVLAY